MAFKPRTQKRIQNLSRAINKLDNRLLNKLASAQYRIEDVEPGINTIKYMQNGVRMEVRYDELENLGQDQQGSLIQQMAVDRYQARQERALEQLRTKGKISWQFKRSLEKDSKALWNQIDKIEEQLDGNDKQKIADLFKEQDVIDNWEDEADEYFNEEDVGSPELFKFYKEFGFEELNSFTWNAYKAINGTS